MAETTVLTLTDFLLARIAEDEQVAQDAAARIYPSTWRETLNRVKSGWHLDHITRHYPARVLAECEAKRKIVAVAVGASAEEQRRHERQLSDETARPVAWALQDVLILLAHPYSDHRDYRDEWLF